MKISIIAACGINRQLGFNGKIPWSVPSDLARFRELTMGHHLVMGRKTHESIGRVLDGRSIIVLSKKIQSLEGVIIATSPDEAVRLAADAGEKELFVCGGQRVYCEFLHKADMIYLTTVDYDGPADVFFPKIDMSEWHIHKTIHEGHDFKVLHRNRIF